MSIEDKALPIPEEIKADSDGVLELVRIWWDQNRPRMIIRPALNDPSTVGAMLAELAWHFSNAYGERGVSQAEAFEAIRKGWDEAHARAGVARDGEGTA